MRFLLFLISILFYPILPIHSQYLDANSIYQSILQEPYYDRKMQLGEKLGGMNTKASKELLRKLLENPYHWNREAAIVGIPQENENEYTKVFIQLFLVDPILRSKIQIRVRKNIQIYYKDLIQVFEIETNPKKKNLLMNLIAISPDSEEYFSKRMDLEIKNKQKKLQTNEKPNKDHEELPK